MSASVRASARNADRNAGAARRIAAEHIESQISHVAVEALDALDPKIVSGQARHLWPAGRRRGEYRKVFVEASQVLRNAASKRGDCHQRIVLAERGALA